MTDPTSYPPDIAPRFQPPPGWRWDYFTDRAGRKLRFGSVSPADAPPRAVVVGLQGLSECGEKYFETARDMVARGFSFWMMDWQGQGLSHRYLRNPQKRHSEGFDTDVADFRLFLNDHVLPASRRPDGSSPPLVMLAHSMGANIGLRYLQSSIGVFSAAVMSAPLLGIYEIRDYPPWLARILTRMLGILAGRVYIIGGGKEWAPDRVQRHPPLLSSDPARGDILKSWFLHNPALQTGNVTYGWLDAAYTSCRALWRHNAAHPVPTPCLFALAGHETLVDNGAARNFAALLPQAEVIEIKDAGHELLMERDPLRDRFLAAFDGFLDRHVVIPPLKRT